MTRRITSIGQADPAMTPVPQGRDIESRETGVLQHSDEHCGHTMQGGGALCTDRFQHRRSIETLPGTTMVAPCVTQARLATTKPLT